jgi:hypothetical protein
MTTRPPSLLLSLAFLSVAYGGRRTAGLLVEDGIDVVEDGTDTVADAPIVEDGINAVELAR